MKPPIAEKKPPSAATPLDPKRFPLDAQTPAAATRDKVREVVRVNSPRQSQRPVERSK